MEKIKQFESIRKIKTIGVITAIVFTLSVLYNLLAIIVNSTSIFTIIIPIIFVIIGIYLFINPVKQALFIYLFMFLIYFVINVGLVVMISGIEYAGQIVFEIIWLTYFIYQYWQVKDTDITEDVKQEYKDCLVAFEKNDLFYFIRTTIIQSNKWICTIYGDYILVKYRYKFMKRLIDKKTFSLEFEDVYRPLLLGYVKYNGKRNMCRMKKTEYEAYMKLLKKKR